MKVPHLARPDIPGAVLRVPDDLRHIDWVIVVVHPENLRLNVDVESVLIRRRVTADLDEAPTVSRRPATEAVVVDVCEVLIVRTTIDRLDPNCGIEPGNRVPDDLENSTLARLDGSSDRVASGSYVSLSA
ncbi:hypothetical protein D8S78_01775 [Natrialba swarupiae]|nr:hypothetical protein [Natrialba swarupiae]